MRRVASVAGAGSTYKSLMARLAALQEGIGPEPVPDGSKVELELAASYRKRIVRTYFGCGLVTSLVVGSAALLPMLHAGTPRLQGLHESTHADLGSAPFREGQIARTPVAGTDSFELPIRHSQRKDAPFPLQITGAGPGDAISVVLRDVPEATWLSRGERQDEHTWLLQPADLDNLRLSLREGTPDAFDVAIEVASAAGDQTARGVARIRVLDSPTPRQPAEATTDKPSARSAELTIDPKSAPQRGLDAPFRTTVTTPRPADTAPQQAQKSATLQPVKPQLPSAEEAAAALLPSGAVRVTRPDGMSALGALPRGSEQDGRQLWWKMPTPTSTPAWAPFPDLPGRN